MIGLKVNGKPLLRAYSIASPNYEEHLEFLSIKVPDGPLTSKLQNIQVGDTIIVGKKPTGTLLIDYLLPGKNLYLIGTGTGLAPWLAVAATPRPMSVSTTWSWCTACARCKSWPTRSCSKELPEHEFLGDIVKGKLHYYPTVTREPFRNQGRISDQINAGTFPQNLGLPD
jgi:ferredoxin--NADP+ reductase